MDITINQSSSNDQHPIDLLYVYPFELLLRFINHPFIKLIIYKPLDNDHWKNKAHVFYRQLRDKSSRFWQKRPIDDYIQIERDQQSTYHFPTASLLASCLFEQFNVHRLDSYTDYTPNMLVKIKIKLKEILKMIIDNRYIIYQHLKCLSLYAHILFDYYLVRFNDSEKAKQLVEQVINDDFLQLIVTCLIPRVESLKRKTNTFDVFIKI